MDDSHFDQWTRRAFGLAAGGLTASVFALTRLDTLDAKKKGKGKKRRRRKKKRLNVCVGKNACQSLATCQAPSSEVFCSCFITAQSGKPFCGAGLLQVNDCSACTAGQACVDARGCGAFVLGCSDPCPKPL
jgi:hypothetical protein